MKIHVLSVIEENRDKAIAILDGFDWADGIVLLYGGMSEYRQVMFCKLLKVGGYAPDGNTRIHSEWECVRKVDEIENSHLYIDALAEWRIYLQYGLDEDKVVSVPMRIKDGKLTQCKAY